MRKLITAAVLVPAAALASTLPAQAGTGTTTNDGKVHAQAVAGKTMPGASPLRQLRSSSVSCSGTLLATVPMTIRGKAAGSLNVYYRTANGGTVISCFKHAGITAGKRMSTGAIVRGAHKAGTKPLVAVAAYGNFASYAGPAAIGGAKGNCVDAIGTLKYGATTVTVATKAICIK